MEYPANNWCNSDGMNLVKYNFKRLRFYCKGDNGGEMVAFKIGEDNCDSFVSQKVSVHLTRQWKKCLIDVTGQNRANIRGVFYWVIDSHQNTEGTTTFYLVRVQFEDNDDNKTPAGSGQPIG